MGGLSSWVSWLLGRGREAAEAEQGSSRGHRRQRQLAATHRSLHSETASTSCGLLHQQAALSLQPSLRIYLISSADLADDLSVQGDPFSSPSNLCDVFNSETDGRLRSACCFAAANICKLLIWRSPAVRMTAGTACCL
ncbi:hypothetical protein Efla_003914 [Eimeria flavescens]